MASHGHAPASGAKLGDLLERVEKATGPDRELDFALALAFTPGGYRWPDERGGAIMWPDGRGSFGVAEPDCLTASLDAAMALVERVLPGWDWIIGHTNGGLTVHAQLGPNEMAFGDTAPLALLAALLKALIAANAELA
jgi:hypothetical protein